MLMLQACSRASLPHSLLALASLLVSSTIEQKAAPAFLSERQSAWRRVVSCIALTCLATALFDQYRCSSQDSVLISAMRGSHPLNLNHGINMHNTTSDSHPIATLVDAADQRFHSLLSRQSKKLAQASLEYKQRYNLPPPPLFDRWFEFATTRNVQIRDDYDTAHDALQPFWALKPSKIRERAREAIAIEDNALIAMIIRDGQVSMLRGGLPWQREALSGMVANFVHLLPDMDVAFNAHDEPRIVVPHDELSKMLAAAKGGSMARASSNKHLRNAFAGRPKDMNDGNRMETASISRFNEYAHQNVWIPSRLSCSPDSPARDFSETATDNNMASTFHELGFVQNQTAFSDICQSPSLRSTHAFFDRPNAFSVAHDLIPIFSESKLSSFQDIVYPSPWHWYGKIYVNRTEDMHLNHKPMYDEEADYKWNEKDNKLFWRGSTSGGYSRDGSWRRQHRQRMIRKLTGLGKATILSKDSSAGSSHWQLRTVLKEQFQHLVNTKFTGITQCDPGDCEAQEQFFDMVPSTNMTNTWQHKHLLDMDGNAFSARFYALMKSRSLVYKMALFREWHEEWLVPWLHFIPLSLHGDEYLETIRFFAENEQGMKLAETLASSKREWAQRALRREDMEAWLFRLLLEYGRVVQDDREEIGYPG